jgi:hypothetical protein
VGSGERVQHRGGSIWSCGGVSGVSLTCLSFLIYFPDRPPADCPCYGGNSPRNRINTLTLRHVFQRSFVHRYLSHPPVRVLEPALRASCQAVQSLQVRALGLTPLRANSLAFLWCVHSTPPSSRSPTHAHPRVFAVKTAFAAFGGILFGYDTGTISGLQQMPDWLRTFGHPVPVSTSFPDGYGISSSQRSLIVSILSAGTFCGPFNHLIVLRLPLTLFI